MIVAQSFPGIISAFQKNQTTNSKQHDVKGIIIYPVIWKTGDLLKHQLNK